MYFIKRDKIRLYYIELELDNTDPDGPFRSSRAKLEREKLRIYRRAEGLDPGYFATGCRTDSKRRVKSGQLRDYQLRKKVMDIRDCLEKHIAGSAPYYWQELK